MHVDAEIDYVHKDWALLIKNTSPHFSKDNLTVLQQHGSFAMNSWSSPHTAIHWYHMWINDAYVILKLSYIY